jgi:hypothetical protein
MEIRVESAKVPPSMEWHVRRALKWITPVDSAGIKLVLLEETDSRATKSAGVPFYIANNTHCGAYTAKYNNIGPTIVLSAQDLFVGLPGPLKYSPLATLRIAATLAHEVGHHLQNTKGFVFSPDEKLESSKSRGSLKRENFAELYASKVLHKMNATVCYRLATKVGKIVSWWYFNLALSSWEREEFRDAAYYFLCAYKSDNGRFEAGRGRQMAAARFLEKADQPKVMQKSRRT